MLQDRKDVLMNLVGNVANYQGKTFADFFFNEFDKYPRYDDETRTDIEVSQFVNDPTLDGYITKRDGVWGALDLVEQYENDCHGKVTFKMTACNVANKIDYIRAETVLMDVLGIANLKPSDIINKETHNAFISVAMDELNTVSQDNTVYAR